MSNSSNISCPEGVESCSVSEVETPTVMGSGSLSPSQVLFMTLISITSLVGLSLNGAIVGLVASGKGLQSICNMYILNRAIADVFRQLPNPFFVVYGETQHNFSYGYGVCVLYSVALQLSTLLGSATFVSMSVDFYVGVRPNHYPQEYRDKLRIKIFTVLWLSVVLLGIAIPFFDPYLMYHDGESIRMLCLPSPFFYSIYTAGVYLGVVCAFLASVVPVLSVWVLLLLPVPSDELENAEENDTNILPRPPTFDTQFMIVLAVVFTLCQLAFWPVQIFLTHYPAMYIPYAFEMLRVLLDVNSALNPIICLIYCLDIQGAFLKRLPRCCRKGEPLQDVQFNEAVSI